MKFGEKLKILRKEMGVTQGELAKHLGVSRPNITQYEKGLYDPSLEMIEEIAKFLHVKSGYFFENKEDNLDDIVFTEDRTISLPIIEALAGCGSAGMLEQLRISEDKMSIDERLLPSDIVTDKLSMIRIVGDSMMPYLDENDWAIIQMRNGYEVTHVNGVYLITHGENVHIKRCAFQADGSCLLISDNPLYPVETAYAGDWDIVGKVVARLKFGSPMLIKE